MQSTASWRSILQENKDRYLEELIDFLKIPSISAVDAHAPDVKAAAEWAAERLRSAGMENVRLFPTGIHDCVYGDWLHAPGKPTVLIYGHFDVQPPDPLDLWESPPFQPAVRDGRIYARGADDMKGNLLLSVIAAEALLKANGELPINVKFLLEGQEEIGSRDLHPFVASHKDLLACDLVLTPDGAQWAEDQPAMWMGFKGLCAMQIDLETAGMDVHSGLYGGAIPNAIHALTELLASFRDRDRNILIEGFHDQVQPLTEEERKQIASVPFNEESYKSGIGVDGLLGETGYSTYERAWFRPTLDVNGIWGGYEGEGVKTVIPAKAHAKITCRLVLDQEPDAVLDAIESHIAKHKPAYARVKTTRQGGSRAFRLPSDLPSVKIVAEVLEKHYGKPPHFAAVGGTLPIMDMFLQELGAYTIDLGFGLDDERMHSPNEFMRLANFERGQVVYVELLERLGLEATIR